MQGLTEMFRQARIAGSPHPIGPSAPKRKHIFVPIISVLGGDRQAGLLLTSRDDHADPSQAVRLRESIKGGRMRWKTNVMANL